MAIMTNSLLKLFKDLHEEMQKVTLCALQW